MGGGEGGPPSKRADDWAYRHTSGWGGGEAEGEAEPQSRRGLLCLPPALGPPSPPPPPPGCSPPQSSSNSLLDHNKCHGPLNILPVSVQYFAQYASFVDSQEVEQFGLFEKEENHNSGPIRLSVRRPVSVLTIFHG